MTEVKTDLKTGQVKCNSIKNNVSHFKKITNIPLIKIIHFIVFRFPSCFLICF